MKIISINISEIIKPKTSTEGTRKKPYQVLLDSIEPAFIKELLRHTLGNKSQAAKHAGLDRGTLDRKIKKHGIIVEKVMSEVAK